MLLISLYASPGGSTIEKAAYPHRLRDLSAIFIYNRATLRSLTTATGPARPRFVMPHRAG
jgi:hypothetical protein